MQRSTRSFLIPLAVMCWPACDFAPAPPGSTPAPAAPESLAPSPYRYGVVEWQDLESDCPLDGAWVEDEHGMALFEGDRLTLVLETTPELSGTLIAGVAEVSGEVQFPGETGALVDCVVAGSVSLGEAALTGEVSERMRSVGDLNCTSRARFRLTFDEQ